MAVKSKIAEPITSEKLESIADTLRNYHVALRSAAKVAESQEGRFICLYGWTTLVTATEHLSKFVSNMNAEILRLQMGNPLAPGELKGRSTAKNDPKALALIASDIAAAKAEAKKLIAEAKKKG